MFYFVLVLVIYIYIYLFISCSYFYWRITVLGRCISFCRTTMWASSVCIDIPSLLSLPPPSPHPSRVSRSTELEHRAEVSCATWQVPTSSLLRVVYMCANPIPTPLTLPFLPPCVHSSILCFCVSLHSCPANRLICTVFLDSIHTCGYTTGFMYSYFSSISRKNPYAGELNCRNRLK